MFIPSDLRTGSGPVQLGAVNPVRSGRKQQ